MHTRLNKKVIVFDLDETLGDFEEFGNFIDGLALMHENQMFVKSYKHDAFNQIVKKYFIELLDLYPEFFRPGIFYIFKQIFKLKKKHKELEVVIYTNNMGPPSWTFHIKNYIEKKIHHKLFDAVITKYDPEKSGNCRSTNEKTYRDLIKCAKIPKNANILFFDDQYHPHMNHKNIQYIQLHPYKLVIRFIDMIMRFIKVKNKFNNDFIFSNHLSKDKFITIMTNILTDFKNKHNEFSKTYRSRLDFDETKHMRNIINAFMKQKHNTRKKSKKKRGQKAKYTRKRRV